MSRVRVLIVDDSNLMRKLLANIIAKDQRLEVVGTAENGQDAIQKIKELQPEVVTLDLNMPVMDGLTTLREANIQKLGPAFLIVSSLAQKDAQITIDAINEGAVDYIPKPSQMMGMGALEQEIITKILMAYESRKRTAAAAAAAAPVAPRPAAPVGTVPPRPAGPVGAPAPATAAPPPRPAAPGAAPTAPPRPAAPTGPGLAPSTAPSASNPGAARPAVAPRPPPPAGTAAAATGRPRLTIFGGSAGSMQLIQKLLPAVSPTFSGVAVFVLHLPGFFTSQLVSKAKEICPIPVEEARDGLPLALRKIYVCPGGSQNVLLARNPGGKGVIFRVVENEAALPTTPSIDLFMISASEIFKDACRGVLISGTGTDGVEGLRRVRQSLGEVFVQDKMSAVANQLPLAALNAGVTDKSLTIPELINLLG